VFTSRSDRENLHTLLALTLIGKRTKMNMLESLVGISLKGSLESQNWLLIVLACVDPTEKCEAIFGTG
jgi:hypothetical protein